jgi:hypothetical protein
VCRLRVKPEEERTEEFVEDGRSRIENRTRRLAATGRPLRVGTILHPFAPLRAGSPSSILHHYHPGSRFTPNTPLGTSSRDSGKA